MKFSFRACLVILAVLVPALTAQRAGAQSGVDLEVFTAPARAPQSTLFKVQIEQNGYSAPSPVYLSLNPTPQPSAPAKPEPPFEANTAWTQFAADSPVTVTVTNPTPFISARILPSHAGITPTLTGVNLPPDAPAGSSNVASFTLGGNGPQQVSVEFCYAEQSCTEDSETVDDITNPLLVFVSPRASNMQPQTSGTTVTAPQNGRPPPLGSGQTLIVFNPGYYNFGSTPYALPAGTAAFLAGGAFVNGTFTVAGGNTISGLGVLSGNGVCPQGHGSACNVMIEGKESTGNVTINGVTLVDSPFYNVRLSQGGNNVSDIKVISWLGEQDGITPGGGQLSNSFFKTGDDAIKLYTSGLQVSGCTLWQLGNAAPFELGVNLKTDVTRVTVTNSDVIRTEWTYPNRSNAVFSAAFGGTAQGSAYTFSDIRIENTNTKGFAKRVTPLFQLFKLAVIPNGWTAQGNNTLGSIENVHFQNITATDKTTLPDLFQSFDRQHLVSDIFFDNVVVHGQARTGPFLTFNANRNLSLSGTVFSNLLWRSKSDPTAFTASVFDGAENGQPVSPPTPIPGGPGAAQTVLGVGDFDGNGIASVLFGNPFSSSTTIFSSWEQPLGTPSSFAPIWTDLVGRQFAGTGDFTGDGRSDILLWDATAQAATVLPMMGQSVGTPITVKPRPSTWSVAGVGDLNETGYSAILLRDQNANMDVLAFGPGGSVTEYPTIPASAFIYDQKSGQGFDPSWAVAAVGDVRGNGYASIIWVNGSGQLGVTGFDFAAPPHVAFNQVFAKGARIVGSGDYNGDGIMDLVLQDSGTGTLTIWYLGYYTGGALYKQGPSFSPLANDTLQP